MKSLFSLGLFLSSLCHANIQLDKIKLPPGFQISTLASSLPGARSMAFGSKGTLFVGTRGNSVYAITPDKKVRVIAKGLNEPNGVAFREGTLFIGEINRISRIDKIEENLDHPPKPVVINDSYPSESLHGWKFIAVGPDKKLYVPVGAPCNICAVKDPYASITRITLAGKDREIFARGIRNTVGFDWHPVTHELWFTENGRDMMGDDMPSDELNRAAQAGLNFGYPFCHQGDTPDPELGKGKKCTDFEPPVAKLGAHVAALGMRFYTGAMFPREYVNQIFIAEHGSWNRTKKSGYRVALVKLNANGDVEAMEPFAQGWLQGEEAWGRPVDVVIAPDGALLISDDLNGAIYRVSYSK